jgi:hypothetical protein
VFLSGRIDVFGLDGPNGRPKRRSIVKRGGRAVAFEMGDERSNFAVSHGDGRSQKLELWNVAGDKPARVGSFSPAGVDQPVDVLGFSSDGRLLISIDASCALHYWQPETRSHLLTQPARHLPCCNPLPAAASAKASAPGTRGLASSTCPQAAAPKRAGVEVKSAVAITSVR